MQLNQVGQNTLKKKNTSNLNNVGSTAVTTSTGQISANLFTLTGTAQETIKVGNGVYVDTSGNVYIASPLKSDNKPITGVAIEDKGSGQTILVRLLGELTPNGLAIAIGKNVFLGALSGGVNLYATTQETKTATFDTIQKVGFIGNTGSLIVNIEEPLYIE